MRNLPRSQAPTRQSAYRLLITVTVTLVATGWPLAALNGQEVSITGTAAAVWGDPPQGSAVRLWYLSDVSGRTFELDLNRLSDEQVAALSGRQVTVSGRLSPTRAGPGGVTARLEVSSLRLLDAAMPASPAAPVSGPQLWASLLCRFPDVTETPRAPAYVESLMGDTYPRLDHYWSEVSYGAVTIAGSRAYGWYDLPQPRSAYVDGGSGTIPDIHSLAQDCAGAADADVDFTQYAGINVMVNANIGCCAWGGASTLSVDGRVATYRTTWIPSWGLESVSILAHEMGHGFGLPHSSGPYEETYDSRWDVMSGGGACRDRHSEFGCVPVHTIAFHKDNLGWIAADRRFQPAAGTTTSLLLEPLDRPATSGYQVARLPIGEVDSYIVEARRFVGYDAEIPGEGVVIHRVDRSGRATVVDPDGDGDPNDEGAIWTTGEIFFDPEARTAVVVDGETPAGWDITIHYDVDLPAIDVAMTDAIQLRGMVGMGDRPAAQVEIVNAGSIPLTDLTLGPIASEQTTDWLTATLDGSAAPAKVSLSAHVASLAPGVYTASVPIISERAANSPFSLEVVLSVSDAVSTDDLVRALAGEVQLSADAIVYLDSNGNGGFDLGDFLRWLDTTGAAPASASLATTGRGGEDR